MTTVLLILALFVAGFVGYQLIVGKHQQALRAERSALVAKTKAAAGNRRHRADRRESNDRRDELRFGETDRREPDDRRADVRRWQKI